MHGETSHIWPDKPARQFAAELRQLRESVGNPSYRDMARRVHYSRTALSEAARGEHLPSLRVALAFVEACGGDPEQWSVRWNQVSAHGTVPVIRSERPILARPAWSRQAVEDGADPDRAGCGYDAVTIDARKVAISDTHIVGQVQLRFSPWGRAAWGRFEGTAALDRLATTRQVQVQLEMVRAGDDRRVTWRCDYVNDYLWCDLLRVGPEPVRAIASVFFDDELVGRAETLSMSLA